MRTKTDFDPAGKRILAITAHPDDADFCCGGTLLKWVSQGAKGAIVVITNGDKGSSDQKLTSEKLAQIRFEEQMEASKFIGLEQTWFLNYPDAHLELSQELKNKLVKIIRKFKPDVVFTWDPTMVYSLERNMVNHPDHRCTGQAALDSVFPLARDFLTFPELKEEGFEPHCVKDVFLFNFDSPNYFVDITEVFDKKIELINKHESQIDPDRMKEVLSDWNGRCGKKINTPYAESFVHLSVY